MSKITTAKKLKKAAEHFALMRELHGEDYGKVQCERCGKMVEPKDIVVGPDPFAHEIYNDNTIVKQCGNCNYDSYMSV